MQEVLRRRLRGRRQRRRRGEPARRTRPARCRRRPGSSRRRRWTYSGTTRMFGKRSCASGKSEVESSTIAVFVGGERHGTAFSTARRIAATSSSIGRPFSTSAAAPAARAASRSSRGRLGRETHDGDARARLAHRPRSRPRRRAPAGGRPSARRRRSSSRHAAAASDPVGDAADDLETVLQVEQELERRAVDRRCPRRGGSASATRATRPTGAAGSAAARRRAPRRSMPGARAEPLAISSACGSSSPVRSVSSSRPPSSSSLDDRVERPASKSSPR